MVPSFVWSTHPVCVPIVSLKRCVLCYSWALLRRPVFRLGLGTGNSLRRSVSLWPRDTIESFPLQGPAVSLQRGTGLQPLLGYHSMSLMSFQFFVVVQSLSHVRFFVTPWTTAHQASLSFTISHSLLKLMSIELVMPSNHRRGDLLEKIVMLGKIEGRRRRGQKRMRWEKISRLPSACVNQTLQRFLQEI